ncbi:MAG TPA: hypothetical protein VMV69_30520 [Pirellulales bacterium]|nr:hypothetical protein [Pirellulales bacterium]
MDAQEMDTLDFSDDDFVDPTPREILLRRAEIHRFQGDLDMAGWLEQEAALEPADLADDDPFDMTLLEFGLCETFCELMLCQGVWFIGQLLEWRAGMLLRLPGMNREKLRRVVVHLRRYGLHLRRGRWEKEKWQIASGLPWPPADEESHRQTEDASISSFTTRKIVELWERGVSQREISSRFNLGRNTHYKVWTIIQGQQRRLAAAALRRHLGDPEWLLDVAAERLPDSTQWELVVRVDDGARDQLRGLDTWESRPVRVVESERRLPP